MFKADLRTLLTSDAAIAALVGGGASPETFRIYIKELKQKQTLDSIVYYVLHGARDYALDEPQNFRTTFVHFDCWSKTPRGAEVLAIALEALLSGYTGTVGETNFQYVILENEFDTDDRDDARDAQTTVPLCRVIREFQVQWSKV